MADDGGGGSGVVVVVVMALLSLLLVVSAPQAAALLIPLSTLSRLGRPHIAAADAAAAFKSSATSHCPLPLLFALLPLLILPSPRE